MRRETLPVTTSIVIVAVVVVVAVVVIALSVVVVPFEFYFYFFFLKHFMMNCLLVARMGAKYCSPPPFDPQDMVLLE